MKDIWELSGRVAFWLSWPLLFVYLARSERTRIVVACGDEVLVVRGWLSDGWWGLPGGGLHRGEDPVKGAIRELQEETGIEVTATRLQKLYTGRITTEHGLRHKVYAYGVILSEKPQLSRQRFELTHLAWIERKKLAEDSRTAQDVRQLVTAFYGR